MHSFNSVERLTKNIDLLARFTGSSFSALLCLVYLRFNPQAIFSGNAFGNQFSFRQSDFSALREILVDCEYDAVSNSLSKTAAPRIIDVGAHIGTFGLWCLGKNSSAHILSLEADPNTFRLLRTTAQSATRQGHRWHVIHGAASHSDASVNFSTSGESMGHHVSPDGDVMVPGWTIEMLFEASGFETVDLMKIDIEGAEEAFLCSDHELLKRTERLVVELHPDRCNTSRVHNVLDRYFPAVFEVDGRAGHKPLLLCER
jgi:FkbM family methyltransferase